MNTIPKKYRRSETVTAYQTDKELPDLPAKEGDYIVIGEDGKTVVMPAEEFEKTFMPHTGAA